MQVRSVGLWVSVAVTLLASGGACGGDGNGGGGGTGPGGVCSTSLAPASRSFDASGGIGQVTVNTAAGCAWTAETGVDWIKVTSGSPGSGTGTVAYTVNANPGTDSRTSAINIGGQSHQVTQQGRTPGVCTYELAPAGADVFKQGGTGSFSVGTAADCAWTAVSNAAWVTITSGAQGTGTGTVSFAVARNEELNERVAQIAVAGRTFTIRQEAESPACEYSVAPVEFSPCMGSGTAQANISTTGNCAWTAQSEVPWLTVAQPGGSGSGVISFSYTANYDAPREAPVMVRWPTETLGQNIWVRQAGCRYGVVPNTFSFAAGGGTGTVNVTQQSEPLNCAGPTQDACVWSAVPDVDWITITSPMPRTGDNPASFTVRANTTGAARTGRIIVRNHTVVVTQAGT